MRIEETNDFEFITSLAKSFGMNIHPFDNCLKAWAAYQDEIPIGCVILRECENEYQLDLLAVDEKYQGKGIGTKLMDTALNEAKKLGAKRIFLITRHAKGFYDKTGFIPVTDKDFPEKLFVCLDCTRKKECSPDLMVKIL